MPNTIFPGMENKRHKLTDLDIENKKASCSLCGPVSIYHHNKGGGRFAWHCVEKRREHHRNWTKSEKGKEYYRNYHKKWEASHKEARSRINRRALLKIHGMTELDYDRMVLDRDGKCDICKERPEKLFVDHDHNTAMIRGLLCRHCNSALGYVRDNTEVLRAAIEYLTNSNLIKKE